MSDFNITIDLSALKEIESRLSKSLSGTLDDFANNVQTELEQKTPQQTGRMAKGWKVEQNGMMVTIENDVPYAAFVIDGTSPHDIYPKSAHVLSFVMDGHRIFAKHVHHPGTHPNNFPDEVIANAMSELPDVVQQALQEAGLL